jgi:hypothetical protein
VIAWVVFIFAHGYVAKRLMNQYDRTVAILVSDALVYGSRCTEPEPLPAVVHVPRPHWEAMLARAGKTKPPGGNSTQAAVTATPNGPTAPVTGVGSEPTGGATEDVQVGEGQHL